jgi:uncharacterized Zn-finger protein
MSQDQQTVGNEQGVPCPWCGAKQDLSQIEIDVDSHVSCDDCNRVYTVTALAVDVTCPRCQEKRTATTMELAENAVSHCPACHKVFRVGDLPWTTNVTLERAG